jgi:putative ABC transport system permease protein
MLALKLLLRNALRHPLRSALTVLAVAVAILAFGLLRTVVDAWYAGVQASSATRLITRNAISLAMPLPLAYAPRIRQVEGVSRVSWGNWFGGIYQEEKNFFPNFAVEPYGYLDLYPEMVLTAEELAAFRRERTACVVGRKTAARFGWKLGQTITLRGTIYPGEWPLTIRGIFRGRDRTADETPLLFHWEYVNEGIKRTMPEAVDAVGWYLVGVGDPDRAAQVSAAIDGMFRNSVAETLTETEKAFNLAFISMTEAIITVIRLLSLAVIAIIMVVAANTMAMTARERMREFATLKALGFDGFRIGGLVWGESLALTAAGGALGMALTYPAADYFVLKLGHFFPVFHVSHATLLMDLAAIVVVGVAASLVPSWRAARVNVVEGFRHLG